MKILFCFISIFFFNLSYSQTNNLTKIIDSADYYKNANPNKSFLLLNTLKNKKLSNKNKLRVLRIKYKLYDNVGDYSQQLKLVEPYLITEEFPKTVIYDFLAKTYYNLGDYKQQLNFYKKALDLSKDSILQQIKYYNNIGWSYKLLDSTDKALYYYNKGLFNLKKHKLDTIASLYATLLGNSGLMYTKLKNYEEAYRRFSISINIRKAINNQVHVAGSYLDIAELFEAQKKYKKAIENNKNALQIAKPINGREWVLRSYKNFYSIYKKTGDFKNALRYKESYDSLNRILFNSKKLREQAYLKAEIDYKKSLLDLEKEKNDIENTSLKRLIGFSLASILLILLLIIVFVIRKKNKKIVDINSLLKTKNEEKEILLKEIHHRVKNNLQLISSLLNIQSNYTDKEEVKSMFLDGKTRIKSMALVHQKLYENNDVGHVYFKDYITQLLENLLHTYVINKPVNYKVSSNLSLPIELSITLGLICNEIITNSLKHNKDSDNLKIDISFTQKENNYHLLLSDNGKGFEKDKINTTNKLGINLINILVKQLEGSKTLITKLNTGVTYKISIPI